MNTRMILERLIKTGESVAETTGRNKEFTLEWIAAEFIKRQDEELRVKEAAGAAMSSLLTAEQWPQLSVLLSEQNKSA